MGQETIRNEETRLRIKRSLRMSPYVLGLFQHVQGELGALDSSFLARPNLGVTVYPWTALVNANSERAVSAPEIQRALYHRLPLQSRQAVPVTLGPPRIYEGMRLHVGYSVTSARLENDFHAINTTICSLGMQALEHIPDFHISLGSFSRQKLASYRPEDARDKGPLVHALAIAKSYKRDLHPTLETLELGQLTVQAMR